MMDGAFKSTTCLMLESDAIIYFFASFIFEVCLFLGGAMPGFMSQGGGQAYQNLDGQVSVCFL